MIDLIIKIIKVGVSLMMGKILIIRYLYSFLMVVYISTSLNVLANSKYQPKAEDFLDPAIYKLSLDQIKAKYKNTKFIGVGQAFFMGNTIFPSVARWDLSFDESGVKKIHFTSTQLSQAVVIRKINKKFGDYFYMKKYSEKSSEYFWKTPNGLSICTTFFANGARTIAIVSFSNLFESIKPRFKLYDDAKKREELKAELPLEVKGDLSIFLKEKDEGKAFIQTVDDFERKYFQKFKLQWTGKLKRSARTTIPIEFNKLTSSETIFHFKEKKLNKLTLMIYNKGDFQENLNENDFFKMVNGAKLTLDTFANQKGQYKPNAGVARNHLFWWNNSFYFIKLESSYTKTSKGFLSDYIRLSFTEFLRGVNSVNVDKVNIESLSNKDLENMVVTDPDGAVYVSGVPMVDQGQKGYCACATTARLLNFYGRDIDQHDIAKIAMTDKLGTSLEDLQKALVTISSKLRLHLEPVAKCYLRNENDFRRFLKKIEIEYRKQKFTFEDPLKIKELKKVFENMSLKDQRYKDFKKGIVESINGGKPLVWALALGIMPEPEIPQATGGHMRLIIGYNEKTDEIYYSDTWGAGHEKKSMHLISAFWISSALWELRPR